MNHDQLATLLAVIDEGTFDAAARRLHITASAVSQRVRAMEQAVGQVLVQRSTPVTATAAGEILIRHARQVELLEADALRSLAVAPHGQITQVAIAVNADSLATWFLGALASVAESLPVAFDIHREDQARTASLLRSGEVMAAVTSTRAAVQGCVTQPLGTMRYLAVCAPRFAERWRGTHPATRWLGTAPVVHFDRNDDIQDAFLRRNAGSVGSGARHFIPTSDDFARAILLGLGWGMLPEQQCREPIARGELLPLDAAEPVDVELHWQRWNLRSSVLDALSTAVSTAAASALRPLAA